MLVRIYWVNTKIPNVITAAAGFREPEGDYEYGIEKWEKGPNGWEYKGRQNATRQQELENHKLLRIHLLLD